MDTRVDTRDYMRRLAANLRETLARDDDDAMGELQGFALDVEPLHTRRGDVLRVEILLTAGGPTVRADWDARGAGWSTFSHSWGDPVDTPMDDATYEAFEDYLEGIGALLDYADAGGAR